MSVRMNRWCGASILLICSITGLNCLLAPSYISEWFLMDSRDPATTYHKFYHNFGVVPIKVDLQVRSPDTEYIYPDVKSAQTDNTTPRRGGVYCDYTSELVEVIGAMHSTSAAAYTVFTGNHSWTPVNKDVSFQGYVRARAWHPEDFPQPTVTFAPITMSSTAGVKYSVVTHGLGYVPAMTIVQMEFVASSTSYYFEGLGSNDHPSSNPTAMKWGGLVYAVGPSDVRFWIPSTDFKSGPSRIPNGYIWSMCNGWGFVTNACIITNVFVTIRIWDSLESMTLSSHVITAISTLDVSVNHTYVIDNPEFNVDTDIILVTAVAVDGLNAGYSFTGTGAAMLDTDEGCGGLIYAYTSTTVQLWHPVVTGSYIIKVGPGVGDETNLQYSTVADVNIVIWKGLRCIPPSAVPNALANTTRRMVSYECIPPAILVSGNLVRTCVENDTWSGEAPVCQHSCPYPESGTNSNINITDMGFGSVVNYTCLSGYVQLDGNNSRHCLGDFTWSGLPLVCQVVCDLPELFENSDYSLSSQTLLLGTVATYVCLNGTQAPPDNMYRVCHGNGTWTGVAPTCTAQQQSCPNPKSGTNSNINISDLIPGSIVNYTCQSGYVQVDGNISRQCQDDLTWSGSPLVCQVLCDLPETPLSAEYSLSSQTLLLGTVATYVCLNGTQAPPENMYRVCHGNGTWTGVAPVCAAHDENCPYPESGTNSNINITDRLSGSDVTYTCVTGYVQVDGNVSRQCQVDLTWSGSPLVCQAQQQSCPNPKSGTNSNINISDLIPGSIVNYTCLSGYVQVDGNISRQCQDDLTWSGSPLLCQIVCDLPELFENSDYSLSSQTLLLGTVATYVCLNGTQAPPENMYRVCHGNGTWTGVAPTCTAQQQSCPNPKIGTNSNINISDLIPGSIVNYTCQSGYVQVDGNISRQCQDDLTWSGSPLVCQVLCDLPETSLSAEYSLSSQTLLLGTVATYVCLNGTQAPPENMYRVCHGNGTWTGVAPVCAAHDENCPYPESGTNSNINITDRLSGSEVTYTCVTGYVQVDGNISRQCQVDLTWSGSPLVCQDNHRRCSYPESGTNSNINITDLVPGFKVNYTCLAGYVQVDGNTSRQCQDDLTWSGSPLSCYDPQQRCSYPKSGTNSNINITDMFPGSIVNYTCLSGYLQVDGNISRQCQDDFTWSGSPLVCQGNCPYPETGINSYINTLDTILGAVVNYTCFPDHIEVGGNVSRQCQYDLNWSGSPLLCQETLNNQTCSVNATALCGLPETAENSDYSLSSQALLLGTVATYVCLNGTQAPPENMYRMCHGNGTWTGVAPTCIGSVSGADITAALLIAEEYSINLTVPVKATSSYKRTLVSAHDSRQSSLRLGIIGMAILLTNLALLLLNDAIRFVHFLLIVREK